MAVTLSINGVDRVINRLGRVKGTAHFRAPMVRAVARLQRDMAAYPPQRSGSSYVRTGTLGRRWATDVSSIPGGIEGKVGNDTYYAPLVQSSIYQADIHRGWWKNTDQATLDKNSPAIVRDFQAAIEARLK